MVELAVQDGHHRLVEHRQAVDDLARLDQGASLAVKAYGHQFEGVEAADALHTAGRVDTPAEFASCEQAQLHLCEAGHVTVQRALRNPRCQASGVPEPAGTLLLVAARREAFRESHCAHGGRDRAGVGHEGVIRGTEAQRIVGAA